MKCMKNYLILTLTACFFTTQIVSNSDDNLARINNKTRVKIVSALSAHTDLCIIGLLAVGMGVFLGSTIPQAIQNSQDYTRSIEQGRVCLQQKAQQPSLCHCSCSQPVQPSQSSAYLSAATAQTVQEISLEQSQPINYFDLARTCPTNQNSSPIIPWFAVSNEN